MNILPLHGNAVRMLVFVAGWILRFWLLDNSALMKTLPQDILAWTIPELHIKTLPPLCKTYRESGTSTSERRKANAVAISCKRRSD